MKLPRVVPLRKLKKMKISFILRQHYQSNDNGKTWIPKESLTSEALERFPEHLWRWYTCNLCGNKHVASIKKEKSRDG